MELRHLRYFVVVAEEQNVTRAAARLHLSQPPLTRQIHDLENELGVALFTRSGKIIRLTDAGRVFLEEARASLKRVEEAVRKVRDVASGGQGELHLGYAPTPTVEILPKLLRTFRKEFPHVRVVLHDHSSPEMLAGLRHGRLHAALMMQPSTQAARGLTFKQLKTYPVGIALPANHPFARRRKVSLDDACAAPIVAYSRQQYPDYHDFVALRIGRRARKLRIVEECDSGASLAAAVESGKGVCICASIFATTVGRRLTFLPLDPPPPPAVVGIAHRREKLPATTEALVRAAQSSSQPSD
ncbi:MAG: LysR family transcriptional regulator [Verrucomicrobiales bacterium]|nr:LysR family transcriptional regulator [Verrucomicrobiales bacterium]